MQVTVTYPGGPTILLMVDGQQQGAWARLQDMAHALFYISSIMDPSHSAQGSHAHG